MRLQEQQTRKNELDTNIREIYVRLARRESLRGDLSNMPHEKFLDMVMVYYVKINIAHEEFLSIMVNNDLMKSWGINKEQLGKIAWCNTTRDNPAMFKPLSQVLLELGSKPMENERDIYIISNEKKYLGAVCIVYPGFLEKIAKSIGSDYYILPSSVHECLAVPCGSNLAAGELRKMVRGINKTELKEKDILSESVYRYIRAQSRLVIDNS